MAGDPDAAAIARRLRYAFAWIAHGAVIHWPLSVENAGVGRLYWWLLPWAGLWAYRLDAEAIEAEGGRDG